MVSCSEAQRKSPHGAVSAKVRCIKVCSMKMLSSGRICGMQCEGEKLNSFNAQREAVSYE